MFHVFTEKDLIKISKHLNSNDTLITLDLERFRVGELSVRFLRRYSESISELSLTWVRFLNEVGRKRFLQSVASLKNMKRVNIWDATDAEFNYLYLLPSSSSLQYLRISGVVLSSRSFSLLGRALEHSCAMKTLHFVRYLSEEGEFIPLFLSKHHLKALRFQMYKSNTSEILSLTMSPETLEELWISQQSKEQKEGVIALIELKLVMLVAERRNLPKLSIRESDKEHYRSFCQYCNGFLNLM